MRPNLSKPWAPLHRWRIEQDSNLQPSGRFPKRGGRRWNADNRSTIDWTHQCPLIYSGMSTIMNLTTMAPPLAARLQALGDGNRIRILDALRGGERCVCRLTERLGMEQPLLSHHLRVLREVGLVSGRRDGRWVHYSVIPEALAELEALLAEIRQDAMAAGPSLDRC